MNKSFVQGLFVGLPRTLQLGQRAMRTALHRSAVSGPLLLGTNGFPGDAVGNRRVHGGPDRAVCVYFECHYATWATELGKALEPPAFGENLRVTGLSETQLAVGDILRVGGATVQVTQPRKPCKTLALAVGIEDMEARVLATARTGCYLRVLTPGLVALGDAIELLVRDAAGLGLVESLRCEQACKSDAAACRRLLEVKALSADWTERAREALQRLKSSSA